VEWLIGFSLSSHHARRDAHRQAERDDYETLSLSALKQTHHHRLRRLPDHFQVPDPHNCERPGHSAHLAGSAFSTLSFETASEAELDRFQQFQDLIDRAHQAGTAPILEAALAVDGSRSSAGTRPAASTSERQWAVPAPFRLEALQRYEILERDDWNTTLEGGLLGRDQVELIRRTAYEELLLLADDVLLRQQEHRSGRKLSPVAAARAGLDYLGKAESAHRPTQAFHVLRGRCRKALGDEAAARADRQLADKTPPTLALDYYLRGRAAHDAKQLAEGVKAYEAALRVEPTHYWSLMRLGFCLCDLGQGPEDYAGAARVFTGCILKRPEHFHAYYNRALAYSKLGRYEDAVADWTRAIELDPKVAQALINRGVTYINLGQWDKAIADCSSAIELDPNCSSAIELDPKYARAWCNRGIAHGKLGQLDKAIADCSRAIDLDPKDARVWGNRGRLYGNLGQWDKLVADYSRVIDLNPKNANAWKNRGDAYSRLGRLAQARADYQTFLKLEPANAYIHNHAATTSSQQGVGSARGGARRAGRCARNRRQLLRQAAGPASRAPDPGEITVRE
jgi:tetratricopeptide (TPR) repeat protein